MDKSRWLQLTLGYLALSTASVGFWAQFAPRSFYDSFPGAGRVWISVDGPYNEHLVRDVGGLNLALTVLLVAAILTVDWRLIATASFAALAYGVPHLIYHATNTGTLSTSDVVASLGGLALFATIPVALLIVGRQAAKPNLEL